MSPVFKVAVHLVTSSKHQEKYHQMSVSLESKCRRTSRVLGAMAESYGRRAPQGHEDAECQALDSHDWLTFR